MKSSDSINELAAALSKAQGELVDAFKSSKSFAGNYADLSRVLIEVRRVLPKFDLSVTQLLGSTDAAVTVETVLMHSSGQWLSSSLQMPVTPAKNLSPAQACGVAATYCRRYALSAIIGISQTDTDASPVQLITNVQSEILTKAAEKLDDPTAANVFSYLGITSFAELPLPKFAEAGKVIAKASAAKKGIE